MGTLTQWQPHGAVRQRPRSPPSHQRSQRWRQVQRESALLASSPNHSVQTPMHSHLCVSHRRGKRQPSGRALWTNLSKTQCTASFQTKQLLRQNYSSLICYSGGCYIHSRQDIYRYHVGLAPSVGTGCMVLAGSWRGPFSFGQQPTQFARHHTPSPSHIACQFEARKAANPQEKPARLPEIPLPSSPAPSAVPQSSFLNVWLCCVSSLDPTCTGPPHTGGLHPETWRSVPTFFSCSSCRQVSADGRASVGAMPEQQAAGGRPSSAACGLPPHPDIQYKLRPPFTVRFLT